MMDFNLDDESWLRFTTTTVYLNWLQKEVNTYTNLVNEEVSKTGRVPVTQLKNYRALMLEHGQYVLVQDIDGLLL